MGNNYDSSRRMKEIHNENMQRIAKLQQYQNMNSARTGAAQSRTGMTSSGNASHSQSRTTSSGNASHSQSRTTSSGRAGYTQNRSAASAASGKNSAVSHASGKKVLPHTTREIFLNWHYILFGILAGSIWFLTLMGAAAEEFGGGFYMPWTILVAIPELIYDDFVEAVTGLFSMGYGLNVLISFFRFKGQRIRAILLQTGVLLAVGTAEILLLNFIGQAAGILSKAAGTIAIIIVVLVIFLRKPDRGEALRGSADRLREMERDPDMSEARKRAYAAELGRAAMRSDKSIFDKDTSDIDEIDRWYS